ncbi:MAG: chemotaxis protein CheB, partial [Candidatus Binataceae bacterium]
MPDRTGEPGSPKAAFNIVGIGASAGGVEALSELLAGLPAAPALAFLLVQHRDPTYPSLLVELLSRRSRMPVVEAHDGMVFEVDHIYVVPATCTVTAIDSAVRLHRYESAEQRRRPIDSMFRSLAASRGQSSIGVVLSGTDSDGTLGIEEIKGVGGITFAQEPGSAKFDSMPRKAIATGCVDFMLTPKEIAEKILEVGRHPYMNGVVAPDDQPFSEEENLRKIFRILRAQAHVDFSQYKRNTIERRLGRRMALRHIEKLAQYAELLHGDRVEIDALVQDFLIRVTGFFRDPEAFKSLSDSVFPQLLENRARKEPLRIWVPGCAGGQEVYSIAILLMEFLADHPAAIPIQIFGTDLSEIAIRQARAGEYVANIEEEVSNERLRRFFVKLDDHYQVVKSLRELCIFTRHNVTYDPPFSRIDLICCRNVLIYFELNLQRQVIRSFHYALKPGGFLQLAPSESISQDAELFQLMDARHRLYRKQALASEVAPEPHPVTQAATPSTIGRIEQMSTVPDQPRAQRELERRLLARYAPAAVLIDPDLSIVYFQGETSLYLEHARGAASLDLRKVVRPALLIEVSSALEQARREDTPARREHIHFEVSGKDRSVNIEVAPLKLPDSEATFFAILFEQAAPPAEPSDEHPFARWLEAFRHRKGDSESEKDRRIQQLQREI